MLEGQPQHLGIALLMTAGALALMRAPQGAEPLFGLTSVGWARLSIALALLHQVMVAFVFRVQLHRNLMSRLFGRNDMAIWRALFLPLLVARPVTVLLTGRADPAQIGLPAWIGWPVGLTLLALAVWAMHSTLVYFTLPRALGGDHFRDHFAAMPLVDKGAFRYTSNAMYGVVFSGLWGLALLCDSWNALILALFQQSYIWVHMYCTENPDMDWIYGNRL